MTSDMTPLSCADWPRPAHARVSAAHNEGAHVNGLASTAVRGAASSTTDLSNMLLTQLGPLEAPQCHVCKFTPSGEYLVRLLYSRHHS